MGVKIPVDFTGVEQRGSIRAPEGDYVARIKKVEKKAAKSSGNPMLVVTLEFLSGPKDIQGKSIVDRHILTKESLWTLRNMLEAMGYNVPAKQMKLDVDAMLIGKKVGITVVDGEEYKGRIKSEVADYLPVSSVGERVSTGDADALDEEDEDDGLGVFGDDEEEDDEWGDDESDEEEDEEEDEDSFSFDDDDEEEDEEGEVIELSFSLDDVESAKGADLKKMLKEAMEAGFEFDLPSKPKVAQVREALLEIFPEEEDDEDDEDMDEFSLDDV